MSAPLVSLCMIARDEGDRLSRCIESVRAYVDEIVVADTGSRDRTVEIARNLGARVFHQPWRDDFAEARNAAIERARGRYALVLDADEWLERGPSPAALRERLARTTDEAFTVELVDYAAGRPRRRYPVVRLFRRRPEHRYRGAIHEQIVPSIAARLGRPVIEPATSGLVIGHDGYDPAANRLAVKRERNARLLRAALKKEPGDAALRFFLVRELVPLVGNRAVPGARVHEARGELRALEAVLETLTGPLAVEAARLCIAARLAEGALSEAERLGRIVADRSAALELLRADLDAARGRLEQAARRALACARVSQDAGLVVEPGLVTTVAPARAAEFLLHAGEVDRAARALRPALEHDDGGAVPWVVLAALERACGRPLEALRACAAGLQRDPTDPWAWLSCGEVLLDAGRATEAVEPLTRALRIAPAWERAERALARAQAHVTI